MQFLSQGMCFQSKIVVNLGQKHAETHFFLRPSAIIYLDCFIEMQWAVQMQLIKCHN